MLRRATLLCVFPLLLVGATDWVLIRTTDGTQVEGQADLSNVSLTSDGKTVKIRPAEVLSIHNGAPASNVESEKISANLVTIQGKERAARDQAVEELTAIGIPVVTPLLQALKDTDQHEPRPLYRLFERVMPSYSDGFDRALSLVRLHDGTSFRVTLPQTSLDVRKAGGERISLPWSSIRTIAIRKKAIQRSMPVHSLRHCNQIEYLDTGVVTAAASRVDIQAFGFVRMSWNEDGWASDADGLKKPGSPAYKTNLVGGHPFGALIGRVGAKGEVFFVGKKSMKTDLPAGRLQLAVNDNAHWQNNVGTYTVKMTATDAYDLGDAQ